MLVTGGTGSFGKNFVRKLLQNHSAKRVVIFSRDELKQYEMAQLPVFREHEARLRYFLGDVRDADRLIQAFRGVDTVVHAAALKQVPACEYNPFEAVRTNVIGAQNIIEAAIRSGVEKVVALSTDKACNPLNLYGATKLCSDKLFVAGNAYAGEGGTRFAVVRYGNVIGSRGSVVPLFKRQRETGVLTITHPEMTRFWITLDQGVEFVSKSFSIMQGGEIFVPKIPSMKVVDLASAMAPEAEQKIIGIRPGEKLHEVMISAGDARCSRELEDRYVIEPEFSWWKDRQVQGDPLPENFVYSSDKNNQWLTHEDLSKMVTQWEAQ